MRRVVVARWAGIASLVSVGLGTWASDAEANVPPYLTEQGRLFDASGTPIAAAVTMEFALYTVGTGGTAVWSEKQTITPDSGYFSAELGSVTPFPAGVFASAAANGQNLYLGVTVSTDAEISPRQPLQSVPYALVADNAIGNISPASVSIGATPVINAQGQWVGPSTGLVGPTGPTGSQGIAGTPGVQGPTGSQGTQGVQGPTGPTGSQGIQGVQGPTGPTGSQGIQGVPGVQGAQGFRSCVVRSAATGIGCNSGEILAGGGCTCPAGTVVDSYPVPFAGTGAQAAASWQCSGTAACTAFAMCCN